jgi:serine/threonine protein phosphatase 1
MSLLSASLSVLVIGDVHGCYTTFRSLIESRWNPSTTLLVQLGDLTERGNFTPETVAFARSLEQAHPDRVCFLKGNHEAELVALWKKSVHERSVAHVIIHDTTLRQYGKQKETLDRLDDDMRWLASRPLFWSNDSIFISHAGISSVWSSVEEALVEDHPEGILWTRSPLHRLNKVQVIGHTPRKNGFPEHRPLENCWNIDTGAVFGRNLTALHLSHDGNVLDIILKPTNKEDYPHR